MKNPHIKVSKFYLPLFHYLGLQYTGPRWLVANWKCTCIPKLWVPLAYDFLFDFNRNHASILYCFRDIASYLSKVADFNPPHLHLASPEGVTPVECRRDLWHQKTSVTGLSCVFVCVILRLVILVEHWLATDTDTDGHRAIAYTTLAQRRAVKTHRDRTIQPQSNVKMSGITYLTHLQHTQSICSSNGLTLPYEVAAILLCSQ